MRTRSVTAALAVLAAILLTACAGESGDPEPTGSPTATTPSLPETPSPGPSGPAPSLPPTVPPPPEKPSPGQAMTLTGQVVSGVEPNCLLLQTDSGEYLLFGAAAEDLRAGATVTVRGESRPDMASTCQQGTPFEVTEVVD